MIEAFLHRSPYAAKVRAVVLDSPMLDWPKSLDAQVHLLHLPHWFTTVLKWFIEQRADINFAALTHACPSPERTTPILLFHGTADTQVPIVSSDLFARARPDLITYQRVNDAEHTQAWNIGPQAYEDALKTFLKRVSLPDSPPSTACVD